MRYSILTIVLVLSATVSWGQTSEPDSLWGNVSYISSQNVYVRFTNTEGIEMGDTLFLKSKLEYIPVLIVNNLSSISCVCSSIGQNTFNIKDPVVAYKRKKNSPLELKAEKEKEGIPLNDLAIEKLSSKKASHRKEKEWDGRFSLSTYLNNTKENNINSVFRYHFSLDAQNIGGSKFSFNSNLNLINRNQFKKVFVQSINPSTKDTSNLLTTQFESSNELKVYQLATNYHFSPNTRLSLGREINSNIANIGAVDGLQFESQINHFVVGAIVGYRPDFYSYGLNTKLFQYGVFAGYKGSRSLTSMGYFNQMNEWKTDRRAFYLQHSNTLSEHFDFFGSVEMDLYGWVNGVVKSDFSLSNTYLSVRYKPTSTYSMSLSYDARKNIYYYETFKNFIDSIYDKETRQGLKLNTYYRPFKYLIWGTNSGFRFPTSYTDYSINGYTYLTTGSLNRHGLTFKIDGSALKSNYISGLIYGGSIAHDLFQHRVSIEAIYNYTHYLFATESSLKQHVAELNIFWNLSKKFCLSTDLEATLNSNNDIDGRIFMHLSYRF